MSLGKNGYTKQAVIYLSQNDNQKAYELGKEFVANFPDEMISHYMLAKAAFGLGKYDETAIESRKAFNLTSHPDDMLACAVLASTAYIELKEYRKGLELLSEMEKIKVDENVLQLKFIFSLALEDDEGALQDLDKLYDMNRKMAEELLIRFL